MEYLADLAPDELPDIEYSRVDADQAAYIAQAMRAPENQGRFQVTFLPMHTPEERVQTAQEWAGYEQAKGDTQARDRGAVLVTGGPDRSPEALLQFMEDADEVPIIPFKPFVTHAVLKVVKLDSKANTFDLLRDYYDSDK